MEQMLPGFHAALNVHPMFVHFPIALWLTALLLWLLAVTTRRDDLFTAGLPGRHRRSRVRHDGFCRDGTNGP